MFYVPDVLQIPGRVIQRRQNGSLVGHASVQCQVAWCAKAGVRRAIFTLCGTGIVANPANSERVIAGFGRAYNVRTSIAYDGLEMRIT